jgi:L-fuconolactonase
VILDSHIHLWDDSVAGADWLSDPSNSVIQRPFTLTDYASAVAGLGVDGAIVVTAEQSIGETARLVADCAGSSLVRGVVGWIDLTDFDEQHLHGTVGIRHSVISESEGWLDRPEIRRGIVEFAATGLVLELLVAARDLPAIICCADAHPDLTIVIDHLGSPPACSDAWADWRRSITMLGVRDNLRLKISDPRLDRASIETAVDAVGVRRLMIGSNRPVSLLSAVPGDEFAFFPNASVLSADERGWLCGKTAALTYRLPR